MHRQRRGKTLSSLVSGATVLLMPLLAIVLLLESGTASAQDQPAKRSVIVGTHVSPPFVMYGSEGDEPSGMAIDVWRLAADQLGVTSEYRRYPTFRALLDAAAAGEVDIAANNVTITKTRAERVDFTQPWFDSGLRIMVNESRGVGFWSVVEGLSDAGFLRAYLWLGLVILAATILLTLFDRRFNASFPRRWREGTAESFYTVMSVATSGRMPSRPNLFGWAGRIMQAFWLVCGIAVLAYVTSSVTSVMTALTLTNQIHNLSDLHDKHVGVADGSVAEEFMTEQGFGITEYEDIDSLVKALMDNEVDAVVDDAPVLEYYANSHPDEPLDIVGPLFRRDKYGFALPPDSALEGRVTLEILGSIEKDEIEALRLRYFGDNR